MKSKNLKKNFLTTGFSKAIIESFLSVVEISKVTTKLPQFLYYGIVSIPEKL